MGKKWKRCAHEEKNERKTIPLHKQGGTRPFEHLCSWRSLALALHKQGAAQ